MMVIAQQVQDMIDNCLQFHAEYLGIAEAGSSHVNRDFVGSRLEPAEIGAIQQLYVAGAITQRTLLERLAEGEILGDDFDVDEEIDETQSGGLMQ